MQMLNKNIMQLQPRIAIAALCTIYVRINKIYISDVTIELYTKNYSTASYNSSTDQRVTKNIKKTIDQKRRNS